jgi:hypothetical protein
MIAQIKLLLISSVVISGLLNLGQADEKIKGLKPGNLVPITSMRQVMDQKGKLIDKNTCLAGKNREHRAISIYVRSTDDTQINSLISKVDATIAKNAGLHGYILFVEGDQFDSVFKKKIETWAKVQKLEHLDIAIANSNPEKEFGFTEETRLILVYSNKREVKLSQKFDGTTLNEKAIDEFLTKLTDK